MTLSTLIQTFLDLLTKGVVPAILALALLYFIYGLFKYLTSAGDAGKRSEGNSAMIRGIIALTVMLTVWAIVGLLSNILGTPVGIPQFR